MYYFYEKTPPAYREGESLLLFTELREEVFSEAQRV
jgi:hypothetical protein